jgi:hypothetical protein
MSFVRNDHMVAQIAAAVPDPPLGNHVEDTSAEFSVDALSFHTAPMLREPRPTKLEP